MHEHSTKIIITWVNLNYCVLEFEVDIFNKRMTASDQNYTPQREKKVEIKSIAQN